MKPIKWKNYECMATNGPNRTERWNGYTGICDEFVVETPVGSHAEIINLIDTGTPICPDCGNELSPVE